MLRHLPTVVVVVVLALAAASLHAQKGRDLSKLRACEIVTGKDVAGIAKGKLMSAPLGGAAACSYLIELPGGQVESYRLFLQSAADIEALFKAQTPAEKGERVPGLWDETYVGKQFMGAGLHLVALHRGDMALEVSGERKDVLIAVAKLAISRLK